MTKWFQFSLWARWWMLQYYSHYSEIKCYFLQLKNWCFVTEKWLLYIMIMLMGPEGRGRSSEVESRPFEAFCRNSWIWAQWRPHVHSSWWSLGPPGQLRKLLVSCGRCVFDSGYHLSPANLVEKELLCGGGFCDKSLLLFQLKIMVFP